MLLVLIRGLPGSGKSTESQRYVKKGYRHFEADMFMMVDDVYVFDREKLNQAHSWCLEGTMKALYAGQNVVVSNTFTQRFEMEPYFKLCKELNIVPSIVVMDGKWKSIHNVPEEAMQRMRERWEDISYS